jgi:transposase-like protein
MKHPSEDFKISAVRHVANVSHSQRRTSRELGCSRTSLQRWIQRFEHENSIRRHNRLPVSYKITREQANFAVQYLLEHQTASSAELHTAVLNRFPDFEISVSHLADVVRDLNLTRKRTRHGHFPLQRYRVPVNRRANLRAFYAVTDAQPIDRIISIDETSLSPFMYRAYSRCRLGDRCVQSTNDNRVFTRYTFVAAITNQRVLGWELYDEGGMTTERMTAFLRRLINENRLRNYLFIMDNAGAHRTASVRETIAESGNHFQNAYRQSEYPTRPRPTGSTKERPPKAYKVI